MLFEESTRLKRTVPPPSLARMRTAFSKIEERTLQHYGIEVETMLFNSPEVANERIEPGTPNRRRIAIDYQNLDSISLYSPVQRRWIEIERKGPAVTPGHVLTWAEFSLERELKKARVKAYIEANGGEAPNDLVAQWVNEKSTSTSTTDRLRGERFKFKNTPQRQARSQPMTDTAASSQPISASLFGSPAEQVVAPMPLGEAPATSAASPAARGRAARTAPIPTPAAPEPNSGSDSTPLSAMDSSDLKALAARRGITTHRKD